MSEKKSPYREPPCEVCAGRARAAKKIHPFQAPGAVLCPACREALPRMWNTVCSGKSRFLQKKGFWVLRWWGRVTFKCRHAEETSVPAHFHFECQRCKHQWQMHTALEKHPEAP